MMYHYTDCGLQGIWLANGFRTIRTEYGRATSIENVDGLHRAIARTLSIEKARLSGGEFRFLRNELGLTQSALAEWFGNDSQTVALWERGRKRVPQWADRLIRQLVLETQGRNQRLIDLVASLARKHDEKAGERLVFEERPRKGWVSRAA
jgi:DNA-binding transcriptional regulator YiaG